MANEDQPARSQTTDYEGYSEPKAPGTPFPELDWSWTDEDPGTCAKCGEPFEHVRPGKSQPTCECWEIANHG